MRLLHPISIPGVKLKWTNRTKERYHQTLDAADVIEIERMLDIALASSDAERIDQFAQTISDLILNAARNSNAITNTRKRHEQYRQPWYDHECSRSRRLYNKVRRRNVPSETRKHAKLFMRQLFSVNSTVHFFAVFFTVFTF